ncbi:MAG: Hsp20/alpha crystallin family protein [Clostridium sp.]|nr:Hsp20/alpha crystallin family protein [Clostridium sp.]
MFGLIPFKTDNSNDKGGSLNSLFNDFFDDSFLTPMGMNMSKFNADVRETENEYLVSAELPGVNKEDISLDYKNKYLVINAKRNEEHKDKEDNYIRKERSYGEFSRSFYFDSIDANKISAKFENGVLKVIIPKKIKEEDKSKQIKID